MTTIITGTNMKTVSVIGIMTGITTAGNVNIAAGGAEAATMTVTTATIAAAQSTTVIRAATQATPAADMAIPARSTDAADTATAPAVSASTEGVWMVRTRPAKTSRKASLSIR